MRSSRRVIRLSAAFLGIFAVTSCLEPLEPTPDSSPVIITPQSTAVPATILGSGWTFTLPLRITNTGSRTVFVDLSYRLTEKLIDQKWEIATLSRSFGQWRAIPPSQTQSLGYAVTYAHGTSAPPTSSAILEHARGLYRVGLHLSYTSDENSLLPGENYYSRSFVVSQ